MQNIKKKKERDAILTYNDMDLDIVQNLGADYDEAHDKWTYQGKTVMPQDTAKRLLTHLHRLTHLGKRKMAELLDKNEIDYYIPKRDSLIQQLWAIVRRVRR